MGIENKHYRYVLPIMNQKVFFQLFSSLRKMVEELEGISEYQRIQIPVVPHTKSLSKQKIPIFIFSNTHFTPVQFLADLSRFLHNFPG